MEECSWRALFSEFPYLTYRYLSEPIDEDPRIVLSATHIHLTTNSKKKKKKLRLTHQQPQPFTPSTPPQPPQSHHLRNKDSKPYKQIASTPFPHRKHDSHSALQTSPHP